MANTNQSLVTGWSAQQLGATSGQTGYAQPGNSPTYLNLATAAQPGAGVAVPAGAGNVNSENSAAYAAGILTNPGYSANPSAMTPGNFSVTALGQVGSGNGYQSPSGLTAQVTIAGGTITDVWMAPGSEGQPGTYVVMGTTDGTYTVPPGYWIKVSWSGSTPTWSWLTNF
jgi:hypothetical protein